VTTATTRISVIKPPRLVKKFVHFDSVIEQAPFRFP
jgi:hypothetical protein